MKILLILLLFILGSQALNKDDCLCKSLAKKRIVNGKVIENQNSFPWFADIVVNNGSYENFGRLL